MRALVVYESMYGNTHAAANEIARGLCGFGEVNVVSVGDATRDLVAAADLIVVGGPTHIHHMSSERTRGAARDAVKDPERDLTLDPDAEGPGLREWLEALSDVAGKPAAAFDTRVDGPAALTGRASRGIARRLRRHHCNLVAEPTSFLVDKQTHLLEGETERAHQWGCALGEAVPASPAAVPIPVAE